MAVVLQLVILIILPVRVRVRVRQNELHVRLNDYSMFLMTLVRACIYDSAPHSQQHGMRPCESQMRTSAARRGCAESASAPPASSVSSRSSRASPRSSSSTACAAALAH